MLLKTLCRLRLQQRLGEVVGLDKVARNFLQTFARNLRTSQLVAVSLEFAVVQIEMLVEQQLLVHVRRQRSVEHPVQLAQFRPRSQVLVVDLLDCAGHVGFGHAGHHYAPVVGFDGEDFCE
uniref:(northern house mosquito) hypothetical protein n=1 Tax=Culex pipiens TaxID=7175 RepID=A0A8D8BQ68_CULPI